MRRIPDGMVRLTIHGPSFAVYLPRRVIALTALERGGRVDCRWPSRRSVHITPGVDLTLYCVGEAEAEVSLRRPRRMVAERGTKVNAPYRLAIGGGLIVDLPEALVLSGIETGGAPEDDVGEPERFLARPLTAERFLLLLPPGSFEDDPRAVAECRIDRRRAMA